VIPTASIPSTPIIPTTIMTTIDTILNVLVASLNTQTRKNRDNFNLVTLSLMSILLLLLRMTLYVPKSSPRSRLTEVCIRIGPWPLMASPLEGYRTTLSVLPSLVTSITSISIPQPRLLLLQLLQARSNRTASPTLTPTSTSLANFLALTSIFSKDHQQQLQLTLQLSFLSITSTNNRHFIHHLIFLSSVLVLLPADSKGSSIILGTQYPQSCSNNNLFPISLLVPLVQPQFQLLLLHLLLQFLLHY
jgi:hypothetical protein